MNSRGPTYQLDVSGWIPRSSNAFAHFSVSPNTIAYGR